MDNTAAVEAVMELICDHYCKYPYILGEDDLRETCERCNIEHHINGLAGGDKNANGND